MGMTLVCPLLFVIYVSDLDDNVVNAISIFINDTYIGDIVDSTEGYRQHLKGIWICTWMGKV